MANWSNPTLASLYTTFLTEMKDRDVDAATFFLNTPTNPPTGAIRYNRSTNIFEEWSGAAWVAKTLAIAGGGTGGTTAAAARTALGIGTMGTQNSNAVAITGGTVIEITSLEMKGNIIWDADNAYDMGTNAVRVRNVYVRSGFVLPVGVDRWVTS